MGCAMATSLTLTVVAVAARVPPISCVHPVKIAPAHFVTQRIKLASHQHAMTAF
jgi:hypothetical protein